MNSFVFNSFKQKFLNGQAPLSFKANIIPMNNKFADNFSQSGFSIEQFRTTGDLSTFGYPNDLFEDSKLKYDGIQYTWSRVTETEEQIKPMYVNTENFNEFSASEYWDVCKENSANIKNYANSGFYVLRTKEELNWFANSVNDGNNGIIGVLVDDVKGKINSFIGKDETIPFQGILDGNGFALRNSYIVCNENDNGFVPVLGNHGIIRNFSLFTENGSDVYSLQCNKQINLNHLKSDACDINCGLLVGKNYGTIENIKLNGDTESFKFSVSDFVPQVYSVSNKSDEISNFTDVRRKFDNGENFFFLNSWCVNSPGNICPYVGYFCEGIFAQQAWGYLDNGGTGCIEFSPKMKSYYDTGSESIDLDFSPDDTNDSEKPELTLLAIYMKYDWTKDYLTDCSGKDLNDYDNTNSLDYVFEVDGALAGGAVRHCHMIFDNTSYRTNNVSTNNDGITKTKRGMTDEQIKILKSDPTWLSFNDDPRGRNAVAIVKCKYNNKTYFLELNGIYLAEGMAIGFVAGSLDLSSLPPPVQENTKNTAEDNLYSFYIDAEGTGTRLTNGYALRLQNINLETKFLLYKLKSTYNPSEYLNGYYTPPAFSPDYIDPTFDVSDSIRVFDEDGNPVNVKSYDGFAYSFVKNNPDQLDKCIFDTNKYLLTNVVFNTDAEICTYKNYSVKFASKLFGPIRLKSDGSNNTHQTVVKGDNEACLYNKNPTVSTQKSLTDLNNKFDIKSNQEVFIPDNDNAMILTYDTYVSDNALFQCSFDNTETINQFFLHVNDYKQFIASNYYGVFAANIEHLLKTLKSPDLTDENKSKTLAELNKHFELVDNNTQTHYHFSDIVIAYNDIIELCNDIYEGFTSDYNAFLKNEIDYTNATYGSQVEIDEDHNIELMHVQTKTCISRKLLPYATNLQNTWNEFREYMTKRNASYINFIADIENDSFYTKPDLSSDSYPSQSLYNVTINQGNNAPVEHKGGVISLETFNYNEFMYSPFVSCTNVTKTNPTQDDYTVETTDGLYIFDAGSKYDVLTWSGDNKGNLQKAAELYVKNPTYYGLDYEGNWTTMAVRTSNCGDENINQVNYNWNIMKRMYHDVYKDNDDPDPSQLIWDGMYYDNNVYGVYDDIEDKTIRWTYSDRSGKMCSGHYGKEGNNMYSKAGTCIPKSLLNKPLRMHNMVRAAYNVSPIVGANFGTISNVSGNVKHIADNNFVGFVGYVAGKNVNGHINNVDLNVSFDITNSAVGNVKYKNTPILPYEVSKTMNIPQDPDFVGDYSVYPENIPYNKSEEYSYRDILETVNCLSFYPPKDKSENPQYVADKKLYNDVKDFRYFTSAWYDDTDQTETDDVITYQLKPVFVIGGIVGRVVASNATSGLKTKQLTEINNVSVNCPILPYFKTDVDVHSNFGTLIGQVDIQTTDTNSTNVYGIVSIDNVTATDIAGCIGYIDYIPIDINTVNALYDYPRGAGGGDFGLRDLHTLFAIDVPINLDMPGNNYNKNGIFSINPPRWANVNQSSGAFINANSLVTYGDDVERYYRNIFDDAILFNNVFGTGESKYKFDIPSVYNGPNGLVSVNSVFGSNTVFEPVYKMTNEPRKYALPIDATQEDLGRPESATRFYVRQTCSGGYNYSTGNYPGNTFNFLSGDNINTEDKYFSYTYLSAELPSGTTEYSNITGSIFNNIQVVWDKDNARYYADFTDQNGTEGDGLDYSGHNVLSFGRSMSPTYIRSQINESEKTSTNFSSVLFSAYQKDEAGNKVPAVGDNQLGGFLVYDNSTSSKDLVMFIGNENNAEIDGRSYNLEFTINSVTTTALDELENEITVTEYRGGNILNVSANNS